VMKDAFLFAEVEGGDLLAAGQGSRADIIVQPFLSSLTEDRIVEIWKERMCVAEGKWKWVKFHKAEKRVGGSQWYMDEEFDSRFGFDIVGGLNLGEVREWSMRSLIQFWMALQ